MEKFRYKIYCEQFKLITAEIFCTEKEKNIFLRMIRQKYPNYKWKTKKLQ